MLFNKLITHLHQPSHVIIHTYISRRVIVKLHHYLKPLHQLEHMFMFIYIVHEIIIIVLINYYAHAKGIEHRI